MTHIEESPNGEKTAMSFYPLGFAFEKEKKGCGAAPQGIALVRDDLEGCLKSHPISACLVGLQTACLHNQYGSG